MFRGRQSLGRTPLWDLPLPVGTHMLTLVGAAGLIIGAFLDWIGGLTGVNLTGRAFIQTMFRKGHFVPSVGFVMMS